MAQENGDGWSPYPKKQQKTNQHTPNAYKNFKPHCDTIEITTHKWINHRKTQHGPKQAHKSPPHWRSSIPSEPAVNVPDAFKPFNFSGKFQQFFQGVGGGGGGRGGGGGGGGGGGDRGGVWSRLWVSITEGVLSAVSHV